MIAITIYNIIGLSFLLLLIGLYIRKQTKEKDFPSFVIVPLIVMLILCNISALYQPTALDVYRDKTELEITSVNGEPTDTIVVWKK